LQEGVVVPTHGRASTKGSCVASDEEEEEDTNTDTSYGLNYLLEILLD